MAEESGGGGEAGLLEVGRYLSADLIAAIYSQPQAHALNGSWKWANIIDRENAAKGISFAVGIFKQFAPLYLAVNWLKEKNAVYKYFPTVFFTLIK